MRKFILIFLITNISFTLAQTVTVSDVIDEISQSSAENYIKVLENFDTRFLLTEKRFLAANYIRSQFESMGFTEIELDSFQCRTQIGPPYFEYEIDTITTQINIIATLTGSENPEDIYIICGHYDSFSQNSDPFTTAPGADDNASGTAAVMESARAIMASGFQPRATLKFITFAAEELMYFGDAGSEVYSRAAKSRNDNIKLVINNDMIGFNTLNLSSSTVDIGNTANFNNINDVVNIANNYSAINFHTGPDTYAGADLLGFIENGYSGIYFEESQFSPHYHSDMDVHQNMDMEFMTEVIKAGCAVLISIDQILTGVEDDTLPQNYSLEQNYPNPFNPSTTIKYSLAETDFVSLKIYNLLGENVSTLVNEIKEPGEYQINFDASNLAGGVYFYSLHTSGFTETKKMMLLK